MEIHEKIAKISEKTGIPEKNFREALGIPPEPCSATTIEDVKRAWRRARSGSDAEKSATEKWDELSMEEVNTATTAEQVEKAHKRARNNSAARKVAAEKWDELSMEEINAAANIEQVKSVYDRTRPGSETEKAALLKIYKLFV